MVEAMLKGWRASLYVNLIRAAAHDARQRLI